MISVAALQDAWWLIGLIIGACAYIARMGFKSHALLSRLERLEERDRAQGKDIAMLLKGVFATLDGLHQQGANGQVATTGEQLRDYVFKHHQ